MALVGWLVVGKLAASFEVNTLGPLVDRAARGKTRWLSSLVVVCCRDKNIRREQQQGDETRIAAVSTMKCNGGHHADRPNAKMKPRVEGGHLRGEGEKK